MQQQPNDEDPFAVLGITYDGTTTVKDIMGAYRKLVVVHHPDKNPNPASIPICQRILDAKARAIEICTKRDETRDRLKHADEMFKGYLQRIKPYIINQIKGTNDEMSLEWDIAEHLNKRIREVVEVCQNKVTKGRNRYTDPVMSAHYFLIKELSTKNKGNMDRIRSLEKTCSEMKEKLPSGAADVLHERELRMQVCFQ